MATRLQEIKGKIGIAKKVAREIDEGVIDSFLNVMKMRASLGDSFEDFYDNICDKHALGVINDYLPKNSLLTEDDVRFLYEHKKRYGRKV